MNETDYNARLYEKMKAEQDKYRDWLASQEPSEILNHTYEYTMREDIVMCMEELELEPEKARALLRSPCPLSDVYKEFRDRETEHMSNGSMFAHLEKFKSKDFWSEHRMITFNTLTDKQEYEIVAVFRTVVYTDSPEAFKFYRFIDAESANEFDDFIAKCKELSFYDTGVTAEYGDKLITLSTCEYSRNNSRLVVVAKRITEDGGADAAKTHAEATAEGERPN